MSRSGINRRKFLENSGQAAAGAALVASGGAAVIAPGGAWAATTRMISASQAAALVAMARHLFPHDQLGDQYYAAAVEALDAQAADNPALAAQLATGVIRLDGAMGMPFIRLSEGNQLKVIESLEGTPFFDAVRGATMGAVYSNETVARDFGFEGSSVEYGGYVNRGFDDLGWLPDLPDNA